MVFSLYTACMWMWLLLPVWGTSRAKKKQWQCFIPYNKRTFIYFFTFLVVFGQQNKWKKKNKTNRHYLQLLHQILIWYLLPSMCTYYVFSYSRGKFHESIVILFFSWSFLVFKRFCLFDLYLFHRFGSVSSRILLAINWVQCFTMLRQNKIPRICDSAPCDLRAQQVRARTITFAPIKCYYTIDYIHVWTWALGTYTRYSNYLLTIYCVHLHGIRFIRVSQFCLRRRNNNNWSGIKHPTRDTRNKVKKTDRRS